MTHTDDLCQIISVFDPDGDGADFAYTVGLAARGLPELHIWARPTEGEDPGLDWVLSPHDRHSVLMQFAEDVVAGRVGVGSERTEVYDDGLATVVYRFDPPVDADDVEAYGARPAPVIPIRWRLDRPPAGQPAPVDAATAADIRARVDLERWTATMISRRSGRLVHDGSPYSTRHDQPLGPQHAVVQAVASQLRLSNAELATGIGFTMFAAQQAGWRDGYDRALLAAHARIAGRQAAYDEARARAGATVADLLGSVQSPTPLLSEALTSCGGDDDEGYRDWLLDAVGRYARTTLAAEALADVIPEDLYLSATTVRDVLYADREVRLLPEERLANPLVQTDVGARIGRLSATELKPCEAALDSMSRDERADWSDALLAVTIVAARQRRALRPISALLDRQPAGTRLRRQRRTIERRFEEGRDIAAQRRRYRLLVDTLDGLAALVTLPDDVDASLRETIEAPVPAELRERLGRVDVVTLDERWRNMTGRRAG